MSLLNKLIRRRPDPEEIRPIWDAVVREARNPLWYS